MDLNGLIGFNVVFDFTSYSKLVLQPIINLPVSDKPNLLGYFVITQPDGISTTGNLGSVCWNGIGYDPYIEILRPGSDNTYLKGNYSISFFAQCAGYTSNQFTRSWDMGYSHVAQKLESAIDCFTPSLLYKDTSIYGVGGYNILSQSSKWKSSSFVGNISSVLPILDLAIEGNYYDSLYTINYTKLITYQHSAYIWLSVNEKLITNVSISSITPKSMKVMLSYIVNLQTARDLAKNNCVKYNDLDKSFNDANVLFQLIKARILSGNIIGLIDSFNQLYTITHSYCQFLYTNTNLIIPPYDLSSWGSLGTSSNSGAFTAFYTASIDGETVCPFIIPSNARIDYVKNEIKTLFPSQYTWTGANIILGGGIQLSQGQTIEVHYII